ncbi:MAG: glycyl-radical enzyme activating protein [bacterium]|nr:glycyl-radical enzyme activating protein [bacterium]
MNNDYLQQKGRIFDIQKYSIHDGPGIRTIVFLKGCLFRCRWCCNPESQESEIQQVMIDGVPKTYGRDVTVSEVLDEIEKDRAFYRRSSGGITLSGGECMCQPDFTEALLHGCHEHGLTTAIETTAAVTYDIVERVVAETDYVLMDIKHMNPAKHKEFIGKDNARVLENAMKIARSGANLTIRVPVIPTFNDTPAEIGAIAEFAKELPGVTRMHLLPYHRLGTDKYNRLSRDYLLKEIVPPGEEQMTRLLEEVTKRGLTGQIGG